jgi:hypothetical protein
VLLLTAAARMGASKGVRVITRAAVVWTVLAVATFVFGFVTSGSDVAGPVRLAASLSAATTVFLTAWFGLLGSQERTFLLATVRSLRGIRAHLPITR